nr:3-hydroxyacyl-CoA dehydrogenase/enoyl-CoA hydratase family protein [Bacillus sp. DNRA2]
MTNIRKAVVIGSGVMGSGIAAHLANVGIKTLLLDIVPHVLTEDDRKKGLTEDSLSFRNKFARTAKESMLKAKPSPLYSREDIDLISVGNIDDHLSQISDADWIIEVIVENLQAKQELFRKIEQYWNPGTIVSSNTSGVSIEAMVEQCQEPFRKCFLGTHFFNPPRYMKLLEIIPHPDTEPQIISFMKEFSETKLGRGVVIAKDTPNFIANRIGTYGLMVTIEEMLKRELTVEQVDELTGTVLGRPKSATFRTLDMVGLDTFVSVANNVYENVADEAEKAVFQVPDFLQQMVKARMLGDKTRRGFYQKIRNEKGTDIQVLDYNELQYRSKLKPSFPSLEQAKSMKKLPEKIRTLLFTKDVAGEFAWAITKRVLLYSANKIPEIADDLVAIDQAMKWGFNWELGPFELWDALGVRESVARMKQEGEVIPTWVDAMLESGQASFYTKEKQQTFYITLSGDMSSIQESEKIIHLAKLKEQNNIIFKNSGASLIDIGDDVACLEFHSPNNAIGADIIQMVNRSLDEVSKNYRGLVIGNQGKNFCVGANLMMLLMEAQDENWFEIEQIVKAFQDMTMAVKYFEKPVVAAPFAMTLGGGTEICLPTASIQAAAETYMGLVEVGVGLIPGGGGNKELLLRNIESVDVDGVVDLQPFVNRTFEAIGMAKVSTSAKDAKSLGILTYKDRTSVNKEHLLYDAKQNVLALSASGFKPRQPKKIRVVGAPGEAVMKLGIYQMKCSGYISEHDEKIAKKLAHVLAGGDIAANSYVTEQYLLDLEREAFISLCGEIKTQQRIQHMLLKGKPLRN